MVRNIIKDNSVYDRAWIYHTDEKEVFKAIQVWNGEGLLWILSNIFRFKSL